MVRETGIQFQIVSYQRLDTSLHNTQQYKVCIKGKVPSPTPQCSNYWKGSLLVILDYDRQLYLLTFYLSIYNHNSARTVYYSKILIIIHLKYSKRIMQFTIKFAVDWLFCVVYIDLEQCSLISKIFTKIEITLECI